MLGGRWRFAWEAGTLRSSSTVGCRKVWVIVSWWMPPFKMEMSQLNVEMSRLNDEMSKINEKMSRKMWKCNQNVEWQGLNVEMSQLNKEKCGNVTTSCSNCKFKQIKGKFKLNPSCSWRWWRDQPSPTWTRWQYRPGKGAASCRATKKAWAQDDAAPKQSSTSTSIILLIQKFRKIH